MSGNNGIEHLSGDTSCSGKRLAGNTNFQVIILQVELKPQKWMTLGAVSHGACATLEGGRVLSGATQVTLEIAS